MSERERDRQTDREKKRERHTHTHTQRDRETERQRRRDRNQATKRLKDNKLSKGPPKGVSTCLKLKIKSTFAMKRRRMSFNMKSKLKILVYLP